MRPPETEQEAVGVLSSASVACDRVHLLMARAECRVLCLCRWPTEPRAARTAAIIIEARDAMVCAHRVTRMALSATSVRSLFLPRGNPINTAYQSVERHLHKMFLAFLDMTAHLHVAAKRGGKVRDVILQVSRAVRSHSSVVMMSEQAEICLTRELQRAEKSHPVWKTIKRR
jgi:hypothetical protein